MKVETRRRAVLLGAAGAVLAGCNPGRDLPMLPQESQATYRLGAGDQVRIQVFGEEQLTGEFRLDDQGRIDFPLLGSMEAAGRTSEELSQTIGAALKKRQFLQNPSVAVGVVTYRPVFILGEVAKPGQYPYQPGMTILTAVAVAGGFTYRAVQSYETVVRTRDGVATTGKALPSSFVSPGDVITVIERLF